MQCSDFELIGSARTDYSVINPLIIVEKTNSLREAIYNSKLLLNTRSSRVMISNIIIT